MRNSQTQRRSGHIITEFAPIFKDKLAKLERRGQGHCKEAVKLRNTLELIDSVRGSSNPGRDDKRLVVAAN